MILNIVDKSNDIFSFSRITDSFESLYNSFILEGGYKDILIAIGILFIFVLLKHIVSNIFINLVVKRIVKKTKTDLDDRITEAIQKPIELLIIILGAYLAASVIDFNQSAINFINHVLRTLIIFAFFWAAYRITKQITGLLTDFANRSEARIDDILAAFLENAAKVVIVILGVLTVIQEWGYDVNGLIAGLGIGGLAFALAAQDTVANVFGSVAVMIDKTFTIGDWIKVESVEGTVEDIGFRTTKVRQFDQALVSVPNKLMSNNSIINFTKRGKRRVSFHLGVEYRTTAEQIRKAKDRIKKMLCEDDKIDPQTIFVFFDNYADSSLELFIYYFTKTTVWEEYLTAKDEVNLKIMSILEELEVSVAFPSTSIYIEEDKTK